MTIYAMKFVFGYISYFHFTSFPIIVNRMFDKSKLTCIDTNGMAIYSFSYLCWQSVFLNLKTS